MIEPTLTAPASRSELELLDQRACSYARLQVICYVALVPAVVVVLAAAWLPYPLASLLTAGVLSLVAVDRGNAFRDKKAAVRRSLAPISDAQAITLSSLAEKHGAVLEFIRSISAQGRTPLGVDIEQVLAWQAARAHWLVSGRKAPDLPAHPAIST